MTDVTLRATKGSPLTHTELDNNMISTKGGRKNLVQGGDFALNPFSASTGGIPVNDSYDANMFCFIQANVLGKIEGPSKDTVNFPTQAQSGVATSASVKITLNTIDASIGTTDRYGFEHRIEGYNYRPVHGRATVLSFWHRHSKTGTYTVSLTNDDQDQSIVFEYTQSTTNTWEKVSQKIPALASTTGFDFTTGIGLRIHWTLAAGSDFETGTTGSWIAGDKTSTTNQVNGMDNVVNTFNFALIQFEQGLEETDFSIRSVEEEHALVSRYFEKSYDDSVDRGTSTLIGMTTAMTTSASIRSAIFNAVFKVDKRVIPTMTLHGLTGTNKFRNISTSQDLDAAVFDVSTKICSFELTEAGGTGDSDQCGIHWTADAQL